MIREKQRFNQFWIWGILTIIFVSALINTYNSFGQNSIIALLITILIIAIFYSMRLETLITTEYIEYRFYPLMWRFKKIPFDQIHTIKAITYNPLKTYGGWGFRIGLKGHAYSVRGNKGIFIKLKSGKSLLIGTQLKIDQLNSKFDQLKKISQ